MSLSSREYKYADYEEQFFAAVSFLAPDFNRLTQLVLDDEKAVESYRDIKKMVLKFHHPISKEILFRPFPRGGHLYGLSMFDADVFLHIVRYATREAIEESIRRTSGDYVKGLGALEWLYRHKPLVFRPLFEKVGDKVLNEELLGYARPFDYFQDIVLTLAKDDVIAFIKHLFPETIQRLAQNDNMVSMLLRSGDPQIVDLILPHLSPDYIQEKLKNNVLIRGFEDRRRDSNLSVVYDNLIPSGSKEYSCNEGAVRLIEAQTKLPPLNAMFIETDDHYFHPLVTSVYTNPKLLNMLLRRSEDVELIKIKHILPQIYQYLDTDNAGRMHALCPEFYRKKTMEETGGDYVFASTFAKMMHPFFNYSGTKENFAHIKNQKQWVQKTYELLSENFNHNLVAIMLTYTANTEAEACVIHANLKAMWDMDDLKKIYGMLTTELEAKHTSDKPVVADPAMLVMKYYMADQHLYYLFAEDVEKEQRKERSWLPSFFQSAPAEGKEVVAKSFLKH